MPRQVCLAEPAGDAAKGETRTFSLLECAPLRLSEHDAIWEALRDCSENRLVIDAAHPEEGFPANVVNLAVLTFEQRTRLERTVAEARAAVLAAERDQGTDIPFAKSLNALFDRQREWFALRLVLAQGLGQTRTTPATRGGNKGRRVLLLIGG